MIYKSLNNSVKDFVVTCNCGCQEGMEFRFVKENIKDNNYQEYYIEFCTSKWDTEQDHGLNRFVYVLKKIWSIIRGKDFYYSEIILTPKQWQQFRKCINGVDEGETKDGK